MNRELAAEHILLPSVPDKRQPVSLPCEYLGAQESHDADGA